MAVVRVLLHTETSNTESLAEGGRLTISIEDEED